MKRIAFVVVLFCAATTMVAQTISNSYVRLRYCQDIINTPQSVTETCGEYTWFGTTYTQSGTYEHQTQNEDGCYTIDKLILTLTDNRTSETINDVICNNSYTYSDPTHGIDDTTFTAPGNYNLIGSNTSGCNHIVKINLTAGTCAPVNAIAGLYSVNEQGKQVYFAKGNLNYSDVSEEFSFVANQTDGGYYFPFGTSGYNGRTPISDCQGCSKNLYGTGTYANANYDWGVYNNLTLQGTAAHTWRTLTKDEWSYLLNDRQVQSSLGWAYATVNGIKGIILLPDGWNKSYPSKRASESLAQAYTYSETTTQKWSQMEADGVVFLPYAGKKSCGYDDVSEKGTTVYYWSADCYLPNSDGSKAWGAIITNSSCEVTTFVRFADNSSPRACVRLVQDAE